MEKGKVEFSKRRLPMRCIHWKDIHINIKNKRISGDQVLLLFLKIMSLALIILYLQACAPPLYHVNLKYEPSENFPKSKKTELDSLITVAMFNDIRNVDDKLQLGTVTSMSGDKIPILPKKVKVPEAVTMNIREYLLRSGYKLSDNIPIWNLRGETINEEWGKILVGGNIDELEIVCEKSSQ
jgi:hypothetical protein